MTFKPFAPASTVKGFFRTMCVPGRGHPAVETTTTVFFFAVSDCRMSFKSSEAESSTQSITTRSVLPSTSRRAFEADRQIFVEIESVSRIRFNGETTLGSLDTSRHSNDMSGVTFHLATQT